MMQTLPEILEGHAKARTDSRALAFLENGERLSAEMTYGELHDRARSVAETLRTAVKFQDRVLLVHLPGLQFVVDFLGCLYAGAIPVPVYPPMGHREITTANRITELTQPAAVLTDLGDLVSGIAPQTPRIAPPASLAGPSLPPIEVGPNDLALIQFTSGSTGEPRGVMISHGNLMHNQRKIEACYRQTAESIMVSWLPVYHDMGLIGAVLHTLYLGAAAVLMSPLAFLERPARWLQAIDEFRATQTTAPNFAYDLCVRRIPLEQAQSLDLRSLEIAICGAEPVRWKTLQQFTDRFEVAGFSVEKFSPAYGLAEATLFVCGVPPGVAPRVRESVAEGEDDTTRTAVSCGFVDSGLEIVSADGRSLPEGEVGEIWLRQGSVALGYWRDEKGTQETFRTTKSDGQGWYLRTGDLGFVAEGELYIVGRSKDILIIRGRNHAPSDLESTVESVSPDIRKGCVAAIQVEDQVVIVAEVRPSVSDQNMLRRHISEALARDHGVRLSDFCALNPGEIPKTSSGKIRRSECRQLYIRRRGVH